MPGTSGGIAAPTELNPKLLLAFLAMVVGMFMAILDVQIVSSSLSTITAELSASGDELSWIQTSYLMAEVIVIPITGFISRVLSTKTSYFIAACGFTVMSLLCSLAWNIESMIIFRALQGVFGGVMIPTAFGSIFIIFPQEMRTKVGMIIGLIVTVAPTIGPTVGGYITETLSWHFMFLLNVLPGIFVCTITFLYVDFDKPNYKLLKNFDYLGIILMSISLGSLQYILEEGNNKDWFTDNLILFLSIIVITGFIWLIIRELTCKNPIVDLSTFKNANFRFGCIYSFILGIGLYGSVYLLPLFLFSIAGFNAFQIGVTMIVTGFFQFFSASLAAKMFDSGIDKRIILGIGYFTFSLGCYMNSFLTADSRFGELFLPQMIRGLALMFCFMPINDLALGTIPKDKMQNASGLYNLTRNLGGAIGLAVINGLITSKSDTYAQAIKDNLPLTSPQVIMQLDNYTQMLSGYIDNPETAAYSLLLGIITRESYIIAINNIFIMTSVLFFISILLLPFTANTKNNINSNAH